MMPSRIPPFELEYRWVDASQLGTLAIDDSQFEYIAKQEKPEHEDCHFLCASVNGEVVGIAKLFTEDAVPDLHVAFVEVAKNSRHRGIGSLLIDKIYDYAKEHGKKVTFDGFTVAGRNYLLQVIERNRRQDGKDNTAFLPYA